MRRLVLGHHSRLFDFELLLALAVNAILSIRVSARLVKYHLVPTVAGLYVMELL